MVVLEIPTEDRVDFQSITLKIQSAVLKEGWTDGILTVYVPHTTCGITINENADPDVVRDITMELNKIVPFEDSYRHMEGNSAAHIKTSIFGSSETLIIEDGRLALGTWQGVFLADFDGPRRRKVYLKFIPSRQQIS